MESLQGLDYIQASASAVEGLISTQGWQGLVTSVVISCAVDGFSSEGAFHEFSLGQCLQGAGSAVLVGGALELFAIRNKFGGIARSRLASGISRLAEATGSRVGKGWDMYRYLKPGEIRAADVAALFDIDEALAGVAATRIQQSSALQSLFREGDWWVSVRKMASSAENRAQLLDDLTGDVNLAAAFKERPELVEAWEVAINRSVPDALRLNPDFLRHYSKALAERSRIVDHLKGHINSNGSAKGCHFASEIDNVRVRLRLNQPIGFPSYFDPPANIKLKEALIDIKDETGNWVPKSERSTFFPDVWDEDRVLEEIARLQVNPSNRINDRTWRGNASDGTVIEIRFTGADINNLEFSTIFPKY